MQLKPGDYIISDRSLPATVEQIRFQVNRDGESAVAIIVEYGDKIETRILNLDIKLHETNNHPHGDLPLTFFAFTAQGVSMADPATVQAIQARLAEQRRYMKAVISTEVSAPSRRKSASLSSDSRARQRERNAEKRAEIKDAKQFLLTQIMEKEQCSQEEAEKILSNKIQLGLKS